MKSYIIDARAKNVWKNIKYRKLSYKDRIALTMIIIGTTFNPAVVFLELVVFFHKYTVN